MKAAAAARGLLHKGRVLKGRLKRGNRKGVKRIAGNGGACDSRRDTFYVGIDSNT
jgi:hypothetical protein